MDVVFSFTVVKTAIIKIKAKQNNSFDFLLRCFSFTAWLYLVLVEVKEAQYDTGLLPSGITVEIPFER